MAAEADTHLVFHPHANENGSSVDDEPDDTATEEGNSFGTGEKQAEEDYERSQEPRHQESLVAQVVCSEAHVVYQSLHNLDIVFHSKLSILKKKEYNLFTVQF